MTLGKSRDNRRRQSRPDIGGGAFSVAEFRALWLAYGQSVIGDQVARVALSVLVFQRTNSPAWTATTYALTYLPALVSGVLLSGLADRYPRRKVMVSADLLRAVLIATMAVPGMPLPLVASLLIAVQLAEAPFISAQRSTLPAVLGEGDRYEQGQRIMLITYQAGQLAGFAGAGVVVTWLGTHLSLLGDAATFLVSAILIHRSVFDRPTPTSALQTGLTPQLRNGARLIWHDRRLRVLVGLGWLATFSIVAEGLAVPLADEIGAGTASIGLLLGARPAGAIMGAYLLGRAWVGQQRRLAWLGILAIGTTLPYVPFALHPNLAATLVLLVLSGACSAYQITAGGTFVRIAPDHQRGQAFGLARSGQVALQGLGIAVGGLIAQITGTAAETIALVGTAGVLCAVAMAVAWSRIDQADVAAAEP